MSIHASKATKLFRRRRLTDNGVSENDQCATKARVALGALCCRARTADAKVSSPASASAQTPPAKKHCILCKDRRSKKKRIVGSIVFCMRHNPYLLNPVRPLECGEPFVAQQVSLKGREHGQVI